MKDYFSKVSLVIPTKNRLFFVKKLIDYYKLINFKSEIHIGDASDRGNFIKLQKYADLNKDYLKIKCYWLPNLPEGATSKKILSFVSTPYVLWSGDDDYFLKEGIKDCVKFLENNTNYIAVNGLTYFLTISTSNFKIISADNYPMHSYSISSAKKRLLHINNNPRGDIFYSMHRTENMKNNYKYSDKVESHFIATGAMPKLMSALQGNIKNINTLFLVRTRHEKHFEDSIKINYNEMKKTNEYRKANLIMKNYLNRELSKIDNISLIKSTKFIDYVIDMGNKLGLKRKNKFIEIRNKRNKSIIKRYGFTISEKIKSYYRFYRLKKIYFIYFIKLIYK